MRRVHYYRRVFAAYVARKPSQLTFWHEVPAASAAQPGELGEYWMTFRSKADYPGPFDQQGVPLLDYHGVVGIQYNPIAIAQYGLGNFNLFLSTGDASRLAKSTAIADWLVEKLEPNPRGLWVWNHYFDFEYRSTLRSPWYSGLAQGQGISLLVRLHRHTGEQRYLDAASKAMRAFDVSIDDGGVNYRDPAGNHWYEEYIVFPPTHILNGFIWALWGIYDYWLATSDRHAEDLFNTGVKTILDNLDRYDTGYWSLYELSKARLPMMASPFYHRLHIVQLRIMSALTGHQAFADVADRWESYAASSFNRRRAFAQKVLFKAFYY